MTTAAKSDVGTQIKVLVVSSVVPDGNGFGGPLVLHRYLKLNPSLRTEVFTWDDYPLRLKIIGTLRKMGLVKISGFFECLWPVLPPLKMIREKIKSFQPDVILTVAHGFWHIQAAAAAKEFSLPLVAFFQDWWPEFPEIPSWFRSSVEKQIIRTRDASDISICVSEGMRQMLDRRSNCILIHDLPSKIVAYERGSLGGGILRVVYFGNLVEYGPPIEQALLALADLAAARLEVYGPKPCWSPGMEERFKKSANYRGRLAPSELLGALKDFHATLVVMSFAPNMKRRMMTSFPSKLIEATQLGLPVIVWGPEYCSAVQWARLGNRALCVTDPDPAGLRQALETLATDPDEQQRLAAAARQAAATDFNPDGIQRRFMEVLRKITVGATSKLV